MDKVEEAAAFVESLCEPSKMSKPEALDFLEDVISRLEASCESLREEMENENE